MTNIEALITISRRYCMDNYDFWENKYTIEGTKKVFPNDFPDKDYNMFSRSNILSLFLEEIEKIIDKKFISIIECAEELKIIGEYSINKFIENLESETGTKAIFDERTKFIHFINNIAENDLINVLPLPYNKRLKTKETDFVYKQLNKYWNYNGGYWNPLKEKYTLETIFVMEEYLSEKDKENIIDYLKKENKLFYTVDELDYNCETEDMYFGGSERVYTSKEFDWIIYFSHERTVTFGGQNLINFVRNLFSNKMDKINNWK